MVNYAMYKEQRVTVLVDVQNMYYSAKNLYGCKVNFVEILKTAIRGRKLTRALAYVIRADVKDERSFHEALGSIGFEVKPKDLLVFHGGNKKGDWDIGIAMDAVRAAEKCDAIVVVSGDGDFKDLYEYIRGKGCRIETMAFGKTASSSIKDYVDEFIDMDKESRYLIRDAKTAKSAQENATKQNIRQPDLTKPAGEAPRTATRSPRKAQSTGNTRGPPRPRGGDDRRSSRSAPVNPVLLANQDQPDVKAEPAPAASAGKPAAPVKSAVAAATKAVKKAVSKATTKKKAPAKKKVASKK